MRKIVRLLWLVLALPVAACSSFDLGTESGNPTKHGGGPCIPSFVTFDIAGVDGLALTNVMIDGDDAGCTPDGAKVRCETSNKDGQGVPLSWTITADGYEPKALEFMPYFVLCGDPVVEVQLDAKPSQ